MIIKTISRRIVYGIAPKTISSIQRLRYLRSEAIKLRTVSQYEFSLTERFRRIQQTPFATQQIETEFVQLMEKVCKCEPKVLVEIGAFQGGTLSLFTEIAPKDCNFLSVDIAYGFPQRLAFKKLAKGNQRVKCISGDSSSPEIIEKVKKWLKGRAIDVLFIDGDHSYQGVRSDFENYSPLVREEGIIIFHDIVEDYLTRFGTPTSSYTGGVPQLWKELKQKGYSFEEMIENPEQDGFGIGTLTKTAQLKTL